MNVVDPILLQCRINAERPALCAPGTKLDLISYAQLAYMLNNMSRALRSFELQPGQIIGVSLQDKILHVTLVLALMRMGVATVSCRGATLPPELKATAVIGDPGMVAPDGSRLIHFRPEWALGNGESVSTQFSASGDEPCRLILTSGSTGQPKAIAFSHDKLITKNARLDFCQGDRWPTAARLFCDLGLNSSQGFRYVIHMLSRGGMALLFGSDAMATLQSLNLFGIDNMATSPHGLGEYLKYFEANPNVHCNLDHILVAGGQLTRQLAERAWSRMSPHLISLYGATEVGAIATADARLTTDIPGAAGYILPDAEAQIVDSSDAPLPVGHEGTVRLRTGQGVTEYYGDPNTSARMFRDGWFYPGDFGYVTEERLLVITGRRETRLNIGGDKTNPETIEDVIRSFPGILDAAVTTFPNGLGIEEVHALIQCIGAIDQGALRQHCAARLQRIFVPVTFVLADKIPRGEGGKIERQRLLQLIRPQ